MKVAKIYLTAFLALLVFSGSLMAQNPQLMGRHLGFRKNPFKNERMMSLPGMTDQQKDKMKEIHLSGMKAMQPIKNQLGEKQAKMRTLETAENADLKAINNLIDETASLKTTMAKTRAANKQKIRNILNEEQRLIFDSRGHGQRGSMFAKGDGPGTHKKRCRLK